MHQRIILFAWLSLASVLLAAKGPGSVDGIVRSESDGGPLTGVVVLDEQAGRSVITDGEGRFAIPAKEGTVLSFSFLGLKTETVTVGAIKHLEVWMKDDAKVLEDVLVVAYGTSTKESFTGSAETLRADKIKDRPAANVTKMLDGQVAGVMSTSGSGQPGSGADIRIRGFGSINASNAPLIVVDGVPFDGELNSISSADIESISVLKDASAGALYGARGANGVVIITTRSGGEEGMTVSFSARAGVNSRSIPFYETMNARQYMEHIWRACYNDLVYIEGYRPEEALPLVADRVSTNYLGKDEQYNIFNTPVATLFDADGHIVSGAAQKWDENWMKEATAPFPVRQEYQVGINGGNAKVRYMASLSFLDDKGTLKTTGFRRYTARAGGDFKPRKWLNFGVSINYSHSSSDFLGAEGANNSNVWYSAMMMGPIYPLYKKNPDGSDVLENGARVFDYGSSRPAGAQNNRNSVAALFDDGYSTVSDNVSLRAHAGLSFWDFDLTTHIGVDNINTTEDTRYNRISGNATGIGRLQKESAKTLSYTWNQLLSYKKDFSGGHHFDALAGHEFYGYKSNYILAERTGFPFDDFDELALASTLADANSASEHYYIDSWLLRGNYSYADRYYFNASFRMDGSSRFEKKHRWGAFWSVGASWRISQEAFMSGASWLNNLTLKASYGVQGNDNLGSYYAWQSLYSLAYANANRSGAIIASLENANVTWEKNGNLNVGVEFRMFDRFSGTIEYFNRTTTDLLLSYPLPISTGFSGYYANVGSMVNRGVDTSFSVDIFSGKDYHWNVTLIASSLANKVLKLTGDGSDIVNGNFLIREGEPINTFYLSRSAGADPATGQQLYWAYQKDAAGRRIEGSDYVTNDATLAASCKYLLGSRIPIAYGSFATSGSYKGFDVSMLFTWSIGGKIYDSVYRSLMEPSYPGQTYHVNALRSWTQPGQITDVPRAETSLVTTATDRFLIDASYFAIKSVSLGYSLPQSLLSKARIKQVRFFVTGENLCLFSHLPGLDPQASFNGSTSYSYTPSRTVSLGVDFKF
ncbi:MAG: TonB-dependent receptor [Bacteroidales bacterium]|nr:TonB-dependent receptor [Bacteroidales bacterium]